MTVATAFAVSWKPLTNSKPSAMNNAMPSKMNGYTRVSRTTDKSLARWYPAYMMPVTTTTPARTLNQGFEVCPLRGEALGAAADGPACITSTLDMGFSLKANGARDYYRRL